MDDHDLPLVIVFLTFIATVLALCIALSGLIISFLTLKVTYLIQKNTDEFNKYLKEKKEEEEDATHYSFQSKYSYAFSIMQKEIQKQERLKDTKSDDQMENNFENIAELYITPKVLELYDEKANLVYILIETLESFLLKNYKKGKEIFNVTMKQIEKEKKYPYFPTLEDYNKKKQTPLKKLSRR